MIVKKRAVNMWDSVRKNSYHLRSVLQARQTLLEIEMNAENLFLEPNPHTI